MWQLIPYQSDLSAAEFMWGHSLPALQLGKLRPIVGVLSEVVDPEFIREVAFSIREEVPIDERADVFRDQDSYSLYAEKFQEDLRSTLDEELDAIVEHFPHGYMDKK